MTTTDHFQNKPEYYSSIEECAASRISHKKSNPRYPNFFQTIFHAGDVEQFENYRDATNGQICIPVIDIEKNIFKNFSSKIDPEINWKGYEDIPATSVNNTFHYIFDKFKKGIFVKIQEGKLKVFLPFSKVNFNNEWGDRIKVDPTKYSSLNDFFQSVAKKEGRTFNSSRVNQFPKTWYANNCLLRSEFPINEGDTGVTQVKDMFKTLCDLRMVPDMEFFINRRDYPLLKRDYTEPYEHLYDNDALPLLSHKFERYSPILSNVTGKQFADVSIPTPDDWSRISRSEGKFFTKDCKGSDIFNISWNDKKPIAVFRGSSTGCGVTIETNMRLKLAFLSAAGNKDDDNLPFLDAGITKWNVRPRKLKGNPYITSIDIKSLGFNLVPQLTSEEQSHFKYIINIDGHVAAFRLSLEMGMGSVILKVNSPYKMWFSSMIKPNVHFIPISEDLSDLIEKIKWCKTHDEECKQIAKNARKFYNTYLSKNGILDYLQLILIKLRNETGIYLYNYESPIEIQIKEELNIIRDGPARMIPEGANGSVKSMPEFIRTYSFLKGTQWVLNYILQNVNNRELLRKYLPSTKILCQNTHSRVTLRRFFNLNLFTSKEPTTNEKRKETIHEAFVGMYGINTILKEIPNFVYTYSMIEYTENSIENNVEILQEYISGQSFFDYLKSPQFKIQEYFFILVQICVALEVAQETCGFVHYDLYPWNIILHPTRNSHKYDYPLDKNKIIQIQSSLIPFILDYGKSSIIYQGKHHGFIKPYRVSRIQDVLSLLISSLNIILSHHTVKPDDFISLLKLSNFISETGFNKVPFTRSKELKEFLRREHKFSTMLESNKYELEKLSPMSLFMYIQKNFSFKFPILFKKYYTKTIDHGNSRQVFDYYFASNDEEKIKSYTDVFLHFKQCTIPRPRNIIYVYFAIQNFHDNLTSVYYDLIRFLQKSKYREDKIIQYKKMYSNFLNYLSFVYGKQLNEENIPPDSRLNITVDESFQNLIQAPYTPETFLLPGKIKELLRLRGSLSNLGKQRSIFMSVFNNGGTYKLPENIAKYFSHDLESLFQVSSLNILNNFANIKTIEEISKFVYNKDLEKLEERINTVPETECEDNFEVANDYVNLYKEILLEIK